MMNLSTIGTFLIILSMTPVRGLDREHWGTHFVFTFLDYNDTDIKNDIVITAREQVNVSVKFHETNTKHYITLTSGTSKIIPYNVTTTVGQFHQVLPKKAVSVEGSGEVSVYGIGRSKNYGDGFLVLPVMALGTKYITVNCNSSGGSQIAITAVEDSTNVIVNLKPWQYTSCKYNMYPYQIHNNSDRTFVLKSYDVFIMNCETDLTGTLITSTKPVAVITGCSGDKSGEFYSGDHMNEMIPPTSNFGNHHIIVKPEDYKVIVRIVTINSTLVMIQNDSQTQEEILEPRGFHDIQANGSLQINSNQSVLIVVFMKGSISLEGGTFMMIVPPTNRYITHYIVTTAIFYVYGSYSIFIGKTLPKNFSNYTFFSPEHLIIDTQYKYSTSKGVNFNTNIIYSPCCPLVISVAGQIGIGYPGGMKVTDFSGENECQCNPCYNNGWCLEFGNDYRCRCTQNFTGSDCREEVSTTTTIMNTTVITTETTTIDDSTLNITTEATSLNTTEMTAPNTTITPYTTSTSNTTEETTPYTTEMITINTTITPNTTTITSEVTAPNTTITPNTTTTYNTTERPAPNTTIAPDTTTTPNITEMTTNNITEMIANNTTVIPNTTTTSDTSEMTTPNTSEITTNNTTEMTTPFTAEVTTYSSSHATYDTIDDASGSESPTMDMTNPTDIPSSSMTNEQSQNTTETTTSSHSTTKTINTTSASITMIGTTPKTNYTTIENTDKHLVNESSYPCSLNNITMNMNMTNIYLICNDTLYWCKCPCPPNDSYVDLLERLSYQYQRLLLLDAELLGKTIRKRTSAINYRDSHTYIGVSSVGITLIFLSSVVLLDLTNLLKWCCERYKGKKVRFVRKRRPF